MDKTSSAKLSRLRKRVFVRVLGHEFVCLFVLVRVPISFYFDMIVQMFTYLTTHLLWLEGCCVVQCIQRGLLQRP